jgi:predicted regulator of Ras-like GTPase activity (Roadblock/LC7/MglB family)
MAVPGNSRSKPAGFEGGVAGLGLTDLIQLNTANQFSGCFTVRYEDRVGLIFFRDGQIVHVEQGGRTGEEAFIDILEWPSGTFDVEPNVVPTRRTIQKTCEHLLLDAHRVLDERRGATPMAKVDPPAAPDPPPAPGARPTTVDVVRSVPDVTCAVVLTREGLRLGQGGHEEEALAGQAGYLALAGAELGALFEAGELKSGTVRATDHHLLLYVTRTHYLGVSTAPESDPDAVDSAIRSALAKPR